MFSWFREKHTHVCFCGPQPSEAMCSPAGHMALLPAAQDVHMGASGHPVDPLAGAHRQQWAPAAKQFTYVPLPSEKHTSVCFLSRRKHTDVCFLALIKRTAVGFFFFRVIKRHLNGFLFPTGMVGSFVTLFCRMVSGALQSMVLPGPVAHLFGRAVSGLVLSGGLALMGSHTWRL